eukprot:CAMPEP_0170479356 /NCGR_PEP_ID=MMETSP0208-20121228/624_1 /TAXON_ID=197538 /ORGANISM="Strombidium inclinatum, Strain S3" /LENGTH=98 /DNA_ID=CAMNT_0010751733 /DNA_START=210 /DNA_END=506 /DNA_ORIENTATION=+
MQLREIQAKNIELLHQNQLPDNSTRKFLGKWFRKDSDPEEGSEEIDYDLRDGNLNDGDAELSDFENWWGVERQGNERGMQSDDDDDADGGEMMPILDI